MVNDPIVAAVEWQTAPRSLDTIAADLRAMRAAAGEPSYAAIGQRVARRRAKRGVPEHERRIPRTTIFSCFRDGRRRVDSDAVTEIALALGLPESERARWVERLRLARAAGDGAAVAAVRDDVPQAVPYFAGRDAELATLATTIADAGRVWVSGMAGAGKTQVALRLAGDIAADDKGLLFLDLRGNHAESPPVEPAAAQRAILRRLGASEAGSDEQRSARMGQELRASQQVLILDDASGPEQVAAILSHAREVPVIATSRAPLTGGESSWHHLPLGGMDVDSTVAMLRALAGQTPAHGSDEELEEQARRLAEVTGGLPLAIALVGARQATHPGWTLAEHVELIADRLAVARLEPDLSSELDLSYTGLPAEAAALLRSFADLPVAELDVAGTAVLLDTSVDEARQHIKDLTQAGLAVPRGDDRIALHSLTRAYGRERAEETDSPRERSAGFARLGWAMAERVWAAYATIVRSLEDSPRKTTFPYPELAWSAEEANAWLRANIASLLTLAHAAVERQQPDLLLRLSEGLSWWMNLAGYYVDALTLHRAAADVAAEIGDADGLAMASLDAGQLLINGDDPSEAQELFQRATRLVSDIGELSDPGLDGVIRNMSALLELRAGRPREAIELLTDAVALHEERGEDARQLSALVNLGAALHTRGDFDAEAEVLERILRLSRAVPNKLFETYAVANRAAMYIAIGKLDDAIRDALTAARLAEEIQSPYLSCFAEMRRAEVLRRRGELDAAQEHVATMLEVARRIGSELVIAEALVAAATLSADRRELDVMHAQLTESEALLSADDDHVLRGRILQLRGEQAVDETERRRLYLEAVAQFERAGAYQAALLQQRLEG